MFDHTAGSFDRLLLVPGFCEPAPLLWPLRGYLRRRFTAARVASGQPAIDPVEAVQLWPDRPVCRDLERSGQRLAGRLADRGEGRDTVVLTHSLGDWLTRHALSRTAQHRVAAIVSIAPVLREVPFATLSGRWGRRISEMPVMGDPQSAAVDRRLPAVSHRLVLWGRLDWVVRRVATEELVSPRGRNPPLGGQQLIVADRLATHLTIVLQPNIHALIGRYLFAGTSIT